MDFIGELPPERIMNMKILMQNLSEVTDFNSGRIQILLAPYDDAQIKAAIVYGGFVSNSFKVMGTYKNEERAKEIAEYASPERAKEVLNDMFQKYAAGEKAYIMPEE